MFEAPTVAQLAPRIGGQAGGLPPVVAVPRPERVPLSFAQSRLWFIEQLQGPSPVYNMAVALRLGGRLDAGALGAALADVVGRQESLRTLFPAPEGIPSSGWCRLSGPTSAGRSWMPAAGRPAGWRRPSRGGVARLTWPLRCRCGRGCSASPRTSTCWWPWCTISPPMAGRSPRWWLIWGWPMPAGVPGRPRLGAVAGAVCRLHAVAACAVGDLENSDSPIAAQLAYWEQALAGMPERLVLPTDRPYPPVADYRGASVAVEWPAELQQQVRRVAGAHNATSFMVLQAALAVLLAKLSASPEVAVGFPIAGRRDPALDELVGFFVNTLVLRVEVAGDPTVAELLAQVRGRALAAYEHQDVPFEVLVERLNPTRSLTHHPLVQVMLAWQNLPGQDNDPAAGLALGDLEVTPLPADTHTARMDLVFSLAERWRGRCAGRDRRDGGVSHRRVRRGQHRGADRATGGWWRRSPPTRRGGCRRWICSMPTSTNAWMRSVTGRC